MAREKKNWEEDSASVIDEEKKSGPPPAAPGPLPGKASESSTLRGSVADQHAGGATETNDMKEKKELVNGEGGEGSSQPSDGTTV